MRQPPEPFTPDGAAAASASAASTDYPQAVLDWLARGTAARCSPRSVQLWQATHEELSAIVGTSGFMALFNRCIDLCLADYPWLRQASVEAAPVLRFEGLATVLCSQPPAQALAASCALFQHFHQLLVLLIGAALTDGVFDVAWRDRPLLHDAPCALPLQGILKGNV